MDSVRSGKPRARAGAILHVLQLLPDSSDVARRTGNGSGRERSCLVARRSD
jgi:hypothetical protein